MKIFLDKMRLSFLLCGMLYVLTIGAQPFVISGGVSIVQLTSANGKLGMILEPQTAITDEVVTLAAGDSFILTAGTLSTGGYTLNGQVVVALVRGNQVVDVLARQNMNFGASTVPVGYFVCHVSDTTEVRKGDVIRLLTTVDGINYDVVYAATGSGVTDFIPAVDYALPFQRVSMQYNAQDAVVRLGDTTLWPDKVVRGRNFYFYVDANDPGALVVVKANGNVLTPSSDGLYGLSQVTDDYEIDIRVYDPDVAPSYKTIDCGGGERVADLLTEEEKDCLKGLKVCGGTLTSEDFEVFRSGMSSLEVLDLSETTVENDWLPENAFSQNGTLKHIKLPKGVKGSGNNAFYYMKKLEDIVLPETFVQFGLNEFFGTASLKKVWVKWSPIVAGAQPLLGFTIPPCAFRATTYQTDGLLIVPKGCVSAYKNANIWGNFKTIREEAPVDALLMEVQPFDVFSTDGVEEVTSDGVKVYPCEGGCRIVKDYADPIPVTVYDLSGRETVRLSAESPQTIVPLAAGCYLIRAGETCHKVMVTR